MDLIQEIGGKFYSIRPPLHLDKCPYCGRVRKGIGNPRANGFGQAGFNSHVFSCFEKELKAKGFKETRYDMNVLQFPLEKI